VRVVRATVGVLLILGLLGGAAGGVLVGTAGAEGQSSLTRCEADFLGFMVLSAGDSIHSGCEDLTPAYQAGVAAYQQRDAECETISRLAHPIKRTECEVGAKKDGLVAFRASAKAIRAGAPAPASVAAAAAPAATTATTAAKSGGAVSGFVKNHPVATAGLGLGAATVAATVVAGGSIMALLGKLVGVAKAPFAAAARVLA
jgi:hypothetical protein